MRAATYETFLLPLGLKLALVAVIFCSISELKTKLDAERPAPSVIPPPIYLPSANTARLVTLGFNAFAADLLWFTTVNYFGQQYHDHGTYEWFAHRCGLVTELNPKVLERYDFCATLLSWLAKDPKTSNTLLDRAIGEFPLEWHLRYLHAFNSWYFLNDQASASEQLRAAAVIPGAPPAVGKLAARLMSSDPDLVVDFLGETISHTSDPTARKALQERRSQARLTSDLMHLEKTVAEFRSRYGREPVSLEELVSVELLRQVPSDPFGGRYELDGGHVRSTSGEKGLSFNPETPFQREQKGD